jgi:hypothetical protein
MVPLYTAIQQAAAELTIAAVVLLPLLADLWDHDHPHRRLTTKRESAAR